MSKLLILYNYNKYYNRIVKKLATFNDYLALITPANSETPAAYHGFVRDNLNFDYQDGVHASHVINISKTDPTYAKVDQPDYCVLEESYTEGTDVVKKVSRWFVLEVIKIRGNQFRLSLRRDLLADFYEKVIEAPVFIERGNIKDVNDPILYNSENFTFNQIKKKEHLLTDTKLSGKGNGWIVGYLARSATETDITGIEGHAEIAEDVYQYDDLPLVLKNAITAGKGYKKTNQFGLQYGANCDSYILESCLLTMWINGTTYVTTSNYEQDTITGEGRIYVGSSAPGSFYTLLHYNNNYSMGDICNNIVSNATLSYKTALISALNTYYNSLNINNIIPSTSMINQYNNSVYVKNGLYYRLKITKIATTVPPEHSVKTTTTELINDAGPAPSAAIAFKTFLNNSVADNGISDPEHYSPNNAYAFFAGLQEEVYSFDVERVDYNVVTTTIPATRNENLEAPYDLFCIPLGELDVISNNVVYFTTVNNIGLAIARGISIKAASKVYDIQILPYCPYPEMINSDGNIDITNYDGNIDYGYIRYKEGNQDIVGIILYPKHCKGTFDITIPSNSDFYQYCISTPLDILEKKIKSQTRLLRFVSPNFASTFDINVEKNNGITELNVDYYYKPYSPYLHVAPYFANLYGNDFNDPKGLICSGDFSIAASSSQWEQYQIQNKNYELIFNRQIQNLDVNNSLTYNYQEKAGNISAWTAGIQGAGMGAAAGALMGSVVPGIGTVVGGAVGAVAGGLSTGLVSKQGQKYDLEYLSKTQQEARSYAVDMYNYQLGNIQALPYSLTRVSAFTQNNKIFPFLEFYDCTDEEKEALRNKIIYNGMTIMRIGKIKNYIASYSKYVSGRLIRFIDMEEDSHVVTEIANEIQQGAYYYGYDTSES